MIPYPAIGHDALGSGSSKAFCRTIDAQRQIEAGSARQSRYRYKSCSDRQEIPIADPGAMLHELVLTRNRSMG